MQTAVFFARDLNSNVAFMKQTLRFLSQYFGRMPEKKGGNIPDILSYLKDTQTKL